LQKQEARREIVIITFFNLIFTYPIFNALMLLYHFFSDFGLSIILLTLVIYLLLLPLTRRQLRSMKVTLALQPELAEIRRQYAKDLRAQNEAIQALYKRHGITPTSPYLPLLVQAPIFIGLFSALNIVLNHAKLANLNSIIYPFLPQLTSLPNIDLNWFAVFNVAWHISLGLPDPTHILPILTGVATFVQMRMAQPHTVAEIRDAAMQLTQIVQFLLPFVMVFVTIFIAWQFAAGLALYRLTSLLLNIIQQYFITGWGPLLTVPHFGNITHDGGVKNHAPVQEARTYPKSSSAKRRAQEKRTSARRHGKNSRKNRP
jgi:YidC/Oxa1 family membrane protein insertase